jgi:hypothetical protein
MMRNVDKENIRAGKEIEKNSGYRKVIKEYANRKIFRTFFFFGEGEER